MVVRDRRLPDVVADVACTGVLLRDAPVAERVGRADPSAELDGRDETVDVGVTAEHLRVERDGILGARAGEAKRPAAQRTHEPAEQGEPVRRARHPVLVHRDHEVDRLEIRHRQGGPRAPEEMRLTGGQARRGRPDLPRRTEDHGREEMVVQVLADPREVGDDVDAHGAEMIRGADPGEQKELCRADRPAAHDDAVGVGLPGRPLDTGAARALEQDAAYVRPRDDLELLPRLERPEEGRRRAVANAVADRVLHERHAVLPGAVVVLVERNPAFLRCLGDRDVDGVRLEGGQQRQLGLQALVDRPHVVPRPAVGPEVRPRVEVRRSAAHPDHRVQRARPAEHLPAWPSELSAMRVLLRHGLVRPVDFGEPELVQPTGVVDRGVVVGAAGFEDEHVSAGVCEPTCDDGARRPRPYDDDVSAVLAHAATSTGRSPRGRGRAHPYPSRAAAARVRRAAAHQVCASTSTTVMSASATPPTVNSPTVRNCSGASPPLRSASSSSRCRRAPTSNSPTARVA